MIPCKKYDSRAIGAELECLSNRNAAVGDFLQPAEASRRLGEFQLTPAGRIDPLRIHWPDLLDGLVE
jgi:hypothetical protein